MTQHATAARAIAIDHAQGTYLYTKDGRTVIDAISSWWVITHGHTHPKIVEAIQTQAAKLEQVIFSGFTHDPAEELSHKLIELAGAPLSRVFFSDSGSMAVETALKMVIGYFEHTGQNTAIEKRKIIALDGGYHGDTFGAMSAGAPSIYNALYEPYLFDVEHLPFPSDESLSKTIRVFEKHLKNGDVAALIVEPLVQGASGMNIYTPAALKALYDLCQKYDVFFIVDEIMTGFGRTGTMFACDHAGITPDIMCLSKGLTAGFLPMSVTLCTEKIYDAFLHKDRSKMLLQSSSYAGNPIACAAALANIKLWESEDVLGRIVGIERSHQEARQWFDTRPDIENVRVMGSIFAFDVKTDAGDFGYLSNIRDTLYNYYLDHDVLLRPLGNTVYILPPYCIEKHELERIYDTIWRSLDRIKHEGEQRAA
jgi:adenosylmethionine-8-amino-7-oxononanoate aminotransferase